MDNAITSVLLSVVFALLGFVLLFLGYKVFDALTPADIARQVFEESNLAAAVLMGAFIIALAIVVAAAIS
jgi:putative membrane protein